MTAIDHAQFTGPPYADAGQLVAEAIAAALRPVPRVDHAQWAEANIRFDIDQPMPGPYRLDLFPFFRGILETLSDEHPARVVTFRKSAQIGGTVLGDAFVLGNLDLCPATQMVVHPTLPQGRAWVNNKVKPMVRGSARLQTVLSFDNPQDGKATELLFERLDARGRVIVTGANSAASLSQHTVKQQMQDDLSKWQNNDAGDPEDQADTRSKAYKDAKIFKVSTPMIEGSCRINRNFLAGKQLHYHVACPQCGHKQPLEWANMQANIDAAAADPARTDDGAHFTCTDCGFPIEEKHRAAIMDPANGAEWVAHNPAAKHWSFHLWTAYAPLTSWGAIAEAYLAAKGDQHKEQVFVNDWAGLPHKLQGEAPEWTALQARGDASDFVRGRIAQGYYFLFAGADVQADRVEIGVWAFGRDYRRQPIDHIVINGRITDAETRKALDELLLRTTWPDAHGNARRIEHLEIDCGYERVAVVDWCKTHPAALVTPIVGAKADNAPVLGMHQTRESNANGKRVRAERIVYQVGGSFLKGFLYGDLRKSDPMERGFVALGQGFPAGWYEQLTSEIRRETADRRGRRTWGWVVLPGKRNEVLDVAVYAHHCAERLGWKRLTPAQWDAIAADRDRPPAVPDLFTGDLTETVKPAAPAAVAAAAPAASSGDWLGDTSKWTD